jgi:methyl-accepting chemotaxis protein
MVRYGRLLVESDQLRHDTHSLAQQSRGIVKELALYTTLTVSASIAAALLAMLLLFRHLYRSIAVPINRLHGTILRVSDSNGDLERQIALTQLPEDKAGPEEVAQNEIQALSHAFRFMLAAIRDHMARRKCAAPSDISCPNGS